jgi:hypothetical protein
VFRSLGDSGLARLSDDALIGMLRTAAGTDPAAARAKTAPPATRAVASA